MGQLRLPQPVQRCVPLLPLYPRIAYQVDAQVKVVGLGRVEDGRGSLGPKANAPFPIPAHQTGRADFRHPAFRLASPQGTRRPGRSLLVSGDDTSKESRLVQSGMWAAVNPRMIATCCSGGSITPRYIALA